MSQIVEVNEDGAIYLPPDLLAGAQPHTRYKPEAHGERLVLTRLDEPPFWATATPQERALAFRAWASSLAPGPGLSAEAISRDSIYD